MAKRSEESWPLDLAVAVADLRLYLAQRRFGRAIDDLVRKYRPDQPRAPRGTPEGGQWVGVGNGQDAVERIRVAQVGDLSPLNLLDHEGIGGAHTVAEHIGKSDAYLLARVGGGAWQVGPKTIFRYRAGSFPSLAAANRLVNSTLALNRTIVLNVARGTQPDAYMVAQFGAPTGKEATRSSLTSQPLIRITTWVGVYIVHDPGFPDGFRIQTAYPRSE